VNTGAVGHFITILNRDASQEIVHAGTLSIDPDKGADIVSGVSGIGGLFFTGTVRVTQIPSPGPNDKVRLASAAASVDLTPTSTLKYEAGTVGKLIIINQTPAVLITDLTTAGGDGAGPDRGGHRSGSARIAGCGDSARRADVAAGACAVYFWWRCEMRCVSWGFMPATCGAMKLIDYLIGRALYDDVPYKLTPSPEDNQVAANRLPYAPVLRRWSLPEIIFKTELDDKGNPVLDEKGKPKTGAAGLRRSATRWAGRGLQYTGDEGDKATPRGSCIS